MSFLRLCGVTLNEFCAAALYRSDGGTDYARRPDFYLDERVMKHARLFTDAENVGVIVALVQKNSSSRCVRVLVQFR